MKLKPPTFDFWFWLLVGWSFLVPYLYDQAHIRACDWRGEVNFEPWPFATIHHFKCERINEPAMDH